MSSVWNDNALDMALRQVVNKSPPGSANVTLRLFTNNFSPAHNDAIGSYNQCTDGSYSGIVLTGSTWTLNSITNGKSVSYAGQTFNFAGANSLYGWYMTDAGNTIVIAAGNFAGTLPIAIPSGGGTYTVTPTLPLITP